MLIVCPHLRKSKLFVNTPLPVLSVQVHPLGKTEIEDHTTETLWLGASFPLNLSVLSRYKQLINLAKHTEVARRVTNPPRAILYIFSQSKYLQPSLPPLYIVISFELIVKIKNKYCWIYDRSF